MNIKLENSPKYTSFKHLHIGKDHLDVIYIGYNLETTKTEYLILKILAEHTSEPLSSEQIASLLPIEITNTSVVYHISRINAKSKRIGNRNLVKNISKKGYFLNEEM